MPRMFKMGLVEWSSEHSLKILAPWFLLFVIYDIMKIWRKRLIEWINESSKRQFIEQPGYTGSVKNIYIYISKRVILFDWLGYCKHHFITELYYMNKMNNRSEVIRL
jgi:hypothetical protein